LEEKQKNSEVSFVSKLHLVDLMGTERISKTQVEGSTLNEAKHINLSLTHLEQVSNISNCNSIIFLPLTRRSSSLCIRGTKATDSIETL
jgi:hypothetical protein